MPPCALASGRWSQGSQDTDQARVGEGEGGAVEEAAGASGD